VPDSAEVPEELVARLRTVCMALPEAYEEQAWIGTRWCIRRKTFAHVVQVDQGWPPVYAREAGGDGPMSVLTFRSSGAELDALTDAGHPFFRPPWAPNVIGLVLVDDVDWDEVAELVTDSYRLLAPRKLAAAVEPPPRR
jgi:YjbR